MVVTLREANLDRFSALVDAAASRADNAPVLFDFLLAIADLWDRLGLRDPSVDAQLSDADTRERLWRAARDPDGSATADREGLAFDALKTLATLQRFVDGWRRQPPRRNASSSR
jgi:hypothetical protein